jgi:hypothetical protein
MDKRIILIKMAAWWTTNSKRKFVSTVGGHKESPSENLPLGIS